ncbi:zinc ribbon domain-containing protein [Peptoniphilus sp. KCTC 25270]|uniref:zinc ribbon domain-containing protein n=1 Tax=Peptoniphilus sp. KCTC 25270 TaxID=2897414 RepID=UPI001E40C6FD|nr:zinc ribbon domain-containing protein [Peptoniphilus sp. KCTC 25270]MCD1146497.1 zinc ribbon domain-containing protein [Peptoniphilus sp. KCTC 25270]
MFFFFYVNQKQTEHTGEHPLIIHDHCGKYGKFQVFSIANVFHLFIIPLFSFGRRYFVRMSCCGEVYGLDPKIAKEWKKGNRKLSIQDLTPLNDYRQTNQKVCHNCGRILDQEDHFCSHCGTKV